MKTKHEVVCRYKHGSCAYEVTVPAGQPVRDAKYLLSDGQKAYWVENFKSFLNPHSIEYHDAKYYGLVVSAEDVE